MSDLRTDENEWHLVSTGAFTQFNPICPLDSHLGLTHIPKLVRSSFSNYTGCACTCKVFRYARFFLKSQENLFPGPGHHGPISFPFLITLSERQHWLLGPFMSYGALGRTFWWQWQAEATVPQLLLWAVLGSHHHKCPTTENPVALQIFLDSNSYLP